MADYIANTSPLSYLHRARVLDLMPALLGHVIVPEQVDAELRVGRERGYDLPEPRSLSWVEVRAVERFDPVLATFAKLGAGESAVLTLAMRLADHLAIIDELPARRIARKLSIRVTGTLNLLVAAKQRGYLPAVRPILDELQALGFRASTGLRQQILATAGEA